MIRRREIPFLVLLCCGISLYCLFERYSVVSWGWFALSCFFMFLALLRAGRPVRVPRIIGFILIIGLILALNFGVFIIKIQPERALIIFLTILVLAKGFILRTINDYSQLMLLSLLAMMAAGAHQPTQNFSLYAIVYTIIGGYVLFRFHILTEILAHRRARLSIPTLVVATGKRGWFRAFFGTAVVTCALASIIFSIILRQGPTWAFGDGFAARQSATGFAQEITLGRMAEILQDFSGVLRVKYFSDDKNRTYGQTLYLRGTVLKKYVQTGNLWKWMENPSGTKLEKKIPGPMSSSVLIQDSVAKSDQQALWQISYGKTDTVGASLFVIDRPVAIAANRAINIEYDLAANTITTGSQSLSRGFAYKLLTETAANNAKPPPGTEQPEPQAPPSTQPTSTAAAPKPQPKPAVVPIMQYRSGPYNSEFEQMKVVDLAPFQAIVQKVTAGLPPQATPEEKIQKIESWLRTSFSYSLDNRDVNRSVEPVVDFLNRRKKGHCEYFASAMALLARALGYNAQVVVGFKGSQYNGFGDYFLIRNCDAHAWAEIYLPKRGWVRYDPTPPARDELIREKESHAFKWFWDLVDLVQYRWAEKLAASNTDNKTRQEFIKNLNKKTTDPEEISFKDWAVVKWFTKLIDLFKGQNYESVWLQVLHTIVAMLLIVLALLLLRIAIVVAGIIWKSASRYVSKRWEKRFGNLWLCPVEFYRRILLWLAGRGITRRGNETASEFAIRIGQAHPEIEPDFNQMTEVYLAVRFGKRIVSGKQKSELHKAADRIQTAMSKTKT